MRRVLFVMVVAGLGLSPADAVAQDGWWDWILSEALDQRYDGRDGYDARDRYDPRRDPYRYDRSRGGLSDGVIDIILGRRDREYRGSDRGPAFCRNGRGHPVHGRAWCRDKGWDRGGRVVWQRRTGLGDIILRRTRVRERSRIDRGGLMDILGDVVLRRLLVDARLDRRDDVYGRWLTPYGRANVLQIRSGSGPLAELTDMDGDGRVDAVLVPRR
jgi:hypothetical protein